jgi:hypothetical protein
MNFLHKYIFRGMGRMLLLAMLTVLWTACNLATNQSQEKKAREEGKRAFDAMHKDADAEIRKYTERKAPAGPPKKESGKDKK